VSSTELLVTLCYAACLQASVYMFAGKCRFEETACCINRWWPPPQSGHACQVLCNFSV